MSASNTALPRIRAATATDTEPSGEILVPFNISTRINATMCKATKKKIVGGSNAKNSSLSLVNSLVMELNCHEFCRFHGPCSFRGSFCLGLKIPLFEFLRCRAERAEVILEQELTEETEFLDFISVVSVFNC